MENVIDFVKLKQIIDKTPVGKSFLQSKTNGFKHLYDRVYRVLLKEQKEIVKLNVDLDLFDFDDLIDFNEFLCEKCAYNHKDPVCIIDSIVSEQRPVTKATKFI